MSDSNNVKLLREIMQLKRNFDKAYETALKVYMETDYATDLIYDLIESAQEYEDKLTEIKQEIE